MESTIPWNTLRVAIHYYLLPCIAYFNYNIPTATPSDTTTIPMVRYRFLRHDRAVLWLSHLLNLQLQVTLNKNLCSLN